MFESVEPIESKGGGGWGGLSNIRLEKMHYEELEVLKPRKIFFD